MFKLQTQSEPQDEHRFYVTRAFTVDESAMLRQIVAGVNEVTQALERIPKVWGKQVQVDLDHLLRDLEADDSIAPTDDQIESLSYLCQWVRIVKGRPEFPSCLAVAESAMREYLRDVTRDPRAEAGIIVGQEDDTVTRASSGNRVDCYPQPVTDSELVSLKAVVAEVGKKLDQWEWNGGVAVSIRLFPQ